LSALIQVGVQATILAFRTGSYVAALADQLGGANDNANPWAYSISADEAQAASKLDEFHVEKVSVNFSSV
jgi:hypothetical protein